MVIRVALTKLPGHDNLKETTIYMFQLREKSQKNLYDMNYNISQSVKEDNPSYFCLFQPIFDELYDHIKTISVDPEQLSQMEKCVLTEALILIRYGWLLHPPTCYSGASFVFFTFIIF